MRIYTDGSCIVNGGPGGWAFVATDEFVINQNTVIRSGGALSTNNNQMEMMAVLEALRWAYESKIAMVEIFTDSMYVKSACSQMYRWARGDWEVTYTDLFLVKEIYNLATKVDLRIYWLEGHSGNMLHDHANNMARRMAADYQDGNSADYMTVGVGDKVAIRTKGSIFTKKYVVLAKFEVSNTIVIRTDFKTEHVKTKVLESEKFDALKFIKIVG